MPIIRCASCCTGQIQGRQGSTSPIKHGHLYNATDRCHSAVPRASLQLTYHRDKSIVQGCTEPCAIPHYNQAQTPASHHTQSAVVRALTSPRISRSEALYSYIIKLPCQPSTTPHKAAQPRHRPFVKPRTICNAGMILCQTRRKPPESLCEPLRTQDGTYMPDARKAGTAPRRPISTHKTLTRTMTTAR